MFFQHLKNPPKVMKNLLYYNNNQYDRAKTTLKKVIDKYPASLEAKEALNTLENVYMDLGQIDDYFAYAKGLDFVQVSTSMEDSLTFTTGENYIIWQAGFRHQDWPLRHPYLRHPAGEGDGWVTTCTPHFACGVLLRSTPTFGRDVAAVLRTAFRGNGSPDNRPLKLKAKGDGLIPAGCGSLGLGRNRFPDVFIGIAHLDGIFSWGKYFGLIAVSEDSNGVENRAGLIVDDLNHRIA